MAGSTFFVSWQLWEQMTFALACAIAMVLCTGLSKLYWTNRIMRQQEIIDSEKLAHLTQIRKMGLRGPEHVSDVPFGVRAIQSGIEVDGIWISQPASSDPHPERTPGVSRLVSAMKLVPGDGEEAYARARSKEAVSADDAFSIHTASESDRLPPVIRESPKTDADSRIFFDQGHGIDNRGANRWDQGRLNEGALQRLERRVLVEAYVPSTGSAHGLMSMASDSTL